MKIEIDDEFQNVLLFLLKTHNIKYPNRQLASVDDYINGLIEHHLFCGKDKPNPKSNTPQD